MGDGRDPEGGRNAEIYTKEFDSLVYALAWTVRPDQKFRLAVGSFREDTSNTVELIKLDDERRTFVSDPKYTFSHPYPPTKLMFVPDKDCSKPDLLASAGDHLRIWRITDNGVTLDRLLTNPSVPQGKHSEFCAPLTSFDWSDTDPKRLGTCSIDTTCTIWDVERGVVDTQLIAHDREVYDIAWGGVGVFATVSADGSVRVFDLRDKEHSTIIYESPPPETPLLRLGWNKQDPRYMATLLLDSPRVVVLDIRYPTQPVVELHRHQACVNALAWAPHSACHICTVGDDCQALIWDLQSLAQSTPNAPTGAPPPPPTGEDGGVGLDPILAYNSGYEINALQWSTSQTDWVAINFANKTQLLRV